MFDFVQDENILFLKNTSEKEHLEFIGGLWRLQALHISPNWYQKCSMQLFANMTADSKPFKFLKIWGGSLNPGISSC